MVRLATMAAVAALAVWTTGTAQAGERPTAAAIKAADGSVAPKVAVARLELVQRQFDNVVEALTPDVQPAVFNTLSGPMRYRVLSLYARALYGLHEWVDAHEAFMDLTLSSHATKADWLFRMDTALKVGDADDASLAHDRLKDSSDDDDAAPVI
jgi:hypothetical protein